MFSSMLRAERPDRDHPMTELFGGGAEIGWAAVESALMLAVAVAGFRLAEQRTLAQLNAFDFAVATAIGALIARTATSSTSFATGAVAIATLLAVHRVITWTRLRGWTAGLIETPPRVLVAHGRLVPDGMKRAGLTESDVFALLREHGIGSLAEVDWFLYEARGAVTLVRLNEPVGPLVRDGLRAARATAGLPKPYARRDNAD